MVMVMVMVMEKIQKLKKIIHTRIFLSLLKNKLGKQITKLKKKKNPIITRKQSVITKIKNSNNK
ncbi:hypothetical protein GCM10022389_28130 [Flavobacterium cheonanense]|uniref:50S ribosomal protein L29 n=1 Tax=Flavobacterium cheonanense TaxID=706183 RepID=A0ABP7W4T3_9FLAO